MKSNGLLQYFDRQIVLSVYR